MASIGFVLGDIVFPVFMFYFLPPLLGTAAAANLIIDTLVFFIALRFLNIKLKNRFGVLLGLWAIGLVADIAGAFLLYLPLNSHNSSIDRLIDYYTIYNSPFTVILILVAVLISALMIYWLDRVMLKKRIPLNQAKRIALIFAVVTAPYAFLIPISWFGHY